MRNRLFAGFVAVLALSVAAFGQQFVVPVEKFPLTKAANNIDGWLEVLADSRITPELKARMWGKGEWDAVLGPNDPLRASFTKDAPDDVLLRISMKNGYVAKTEPLDRPICVVKQEHWPNGAAIFFITVDYSGDSGEDAALSTRLLQIHGAQFEWAEAKDPSTEPPDEDSDPKDSKSKKSKSKEDRYRGSHEPTRPIRLSKNRTADWKIVDANNSRDVLQIFSRPSSLDKSQVVYVRYRFDGKQWVRTEKEEAGDWDSKQAFPPVTKFP